MKKAIILLLFVIAGSVDKLNAQVVVSDKTGWHKIGEKTVDLTLERDEIAVIGADKFAQLKFKVTEAAIQLLDADVYFEDGSSQAVKINKEIKAPGETSVVKLDGGEREIKKITFTYKTLPNWKDKKARLEIWGLKTNADKADKKH